MNFFFPKTKKQHRDNNKIINKQDSVDEQHTSRMGKLCKTINKQEFSTKKEHELCNTTVQIE